MKAIILFFALAASAVATDFTLTNPTSAIKPGTPSRAFTITVTGGSVGGSTMSCALTDGSVGGTFYPASPATIAASSPSGTTTQFVYTAPTAQATAVTVQAACTGGVTATHTLTMQIGTATKFVFDQFSGTAATNLTAHTPDIGATWVKAFTSGTLNILLNGSGGAYDSGTGHVSTNYLIPTTAPQDQDVQGTFTNINSTTTYAKIGTDISNDSFLNGYTMGCASGGYFLVVYLNNSGTTLFSGVGTCANASTHTIHMSIRQINGLQYVFPYSDDVLISGPYQNSTRTSGFAGIIAEIPTGQTPATTDTVLSNFIGYNADWTSAPPTVITTPDARIFISPGTYTASGGVATFYQDGWYAKFQVTGANRVLMNVNTTVNNGASSSAMPAVMARARCLGNTCADTVWVQTQYPANNQSTTQIIPLASLNSSLTYTVEIYGFGGTPTQSCYTTTICQNVVNSFQFDAGSTVSAATLRPNLCAVFGASYELGYFGGTVSGAPYTYENWLGAWDYWLMRTAGPNCEYSVFPVGSQGWVRTGNGGYPNATTSWNTYASGVSRTFNGLGFNYVFTGWSENDHGEPAASITSNVSSTITAMRSDFGNSTKFFVIGGINPFAQGGDASSGNLNTDIQAGITASGDSGTTFLPIPTEYANSLFNSGSPATWCSIDGIHMNGLSGSALDGNCQAIIGYAVAVGFQAAITPAGSGSFVVVQ